MNNRKLLEDQTRSKRLIEQEAIVAIDRETEVIISSEVIENLLRVFRQSKGKDQ